LNEAGWPSRRCLVLLRATPWAKFVVVGVSVRQISKALFRFMTPSP